VTVVTADDPRLAVYRALIEPARLTYEQATGATVIAQHQAADAARVAYRATYDREVAAALRTYTEAEAAARTARDLLVEQLTAALATRKKAEAIADAGYQRAVVVSKTQLDRARGRCVRDYDNATAPSQREHAESAAPARAAYAAAIAIGQAQFPDLFGGEAK
jgi:hypothetical protein